MVVSIINRIFADKIVMDPKVLNQLRSIGRDNHCDIIEEISILDGRPVFRLRNSKISETAKTGEPFLLSFNKSGIVFELNDEQIHKVIVSYDGTCKRL